MQFLSHKTRRQSATKIKKVLLTLGGVLLLALIVFTHQSIFVIRSWQCQYGTGPCPEPIMAIVSSLRGRSVLRLNQNQIKKDVLATGWGQNPRLTFAVPGTFKLFLEPVSLTFPVVSFWGGAPPDLSLTTATTSAQLQLPSLDIKSYLATQSAQHFLLASSGLLIEGGENNTIAIISSNKLDRETLSKIFTWIKELSYREIKFKSLYFLGNSIVVEGESPPDTVFSLGQNPTTQIAALQEIKKAATIKDTKVIDFRYTNPILR